MSKIKLFLLVLFVIILLFRLGQTYLNRSNYSNGQNVVLTTLLLTDPQIFGKYQKFDISTPDGVKISVLTSPFSSLNYGQTVRISGKITREVLNNNKIGLTIYFPKIEAIESEEKSFLLKPLKMPLAIASFIRQKAISIYSNNLPPASSSLLLGVVFGIKENIPKEFNNALRVSGVTHVISASGMNVTLVAGFLSSFLVIFLRRRLALILAILGILFYALIAGLQPSIIRATIMGILAFSAQILGRQTLSKYFLFIAGYLMVFVSPGLLFDMGFRLSFLSTAGLLFLRPLFLLKTKTVISKSLVGEDLITTICAQIATLPIIIGSFGKYSALSIITNVFVLWTIPPLMIFGSLALILGLIFYPLGLIFIYLCLPLLWYFEKIVVFISSLPAVFSLNSGIPWELSVGYYLILASLVIFLRNKYEY